MLGTKSRASLMTAAIILGCASSGQAQEMGNAEAPQPASPPQNASAAPDTSRRYIVQILATESAKISSPMAGRVITLPFRDGDSFHKGDLLVGFDCQMAQSQNLHAQAEVQKYKSLVETQNNLRKLQSWSNADYQTTRADLAAAQADLGVTKANISYCAVVAPFDGTVSEMTVHRDQFLTLGAPMISIVDPSHLEISFLIPARLLATHKIGTPFHVTIDETGQTYDAILSRVSGAADPVSRTIRVYASITSEHPGLLPGMTGDANF